MNNLFEAWAIECYHKEIDLDRITHEGPDLGRYRNTVTQAMFEAWQGAMEKASVTEDV